METGRIVFEELCKNNRIEFLLEWINCEEKQQNTQQCREFYQQLCQRDFGPKKQKTLAIILKRFY